jgi:methionine synthase I (cobalamin-dependent)
VSLPAWRAKPRPDSTTELQKYLAERILVHDGAMGTTIRTYGLKESDARAAAVTPMPTRTCSTTATSSASSSLV